MLRSALCALTLALTLPMTGYTQEGDDRKLAQEILDKGSALFDTRDAAAMAQTYTTDSKILWISKDQSGTVEQSVKTGRQEVEQLYRDLFKDKHDKTTSRNAVEFARKISQDIIIIYGTFQPDVSSTAKFPFVQVRVKEGDRWQLKSLELFLISQD